MDIMELGAIGELVGGVAVIASLIFVGLQIRHNAKAVTANTQQGLFDSFTGLSSDVTRLSESRI